MKLLRRYKEPNAKWQETTIEECIEHTEGNEYWKIGAVKKMLKKGLIVFTPFAEYKIKKGELK